MSHDVRPRSKVIVSSVCVKDQHLTLCDTTLAEIRASRNISFVQARQTERPASSGSYRPALTAH